MAIQITDYGMSQLSLNAGIIQLDLVKLGSAYNYVPVSSDTDIHGTEVFNTTPTESTAVNANVVKYSAYVDYSAPSFQFGEIGLFHNGSLFALATVTTLITKEALSGAGVGNSIRIDIYLSAVGTNYEMWLDLAESNNSFKMATLQSPDMLPPSHNATPNVYIIQGADSNQSPTLAFTDRNGLWSFDAYQYASILRATVVSATNNSVTVDLSDYSSNMQPAYFGAVILEFVTGGLYSICRYVTSTVVAGTTATLNFNTQILQQPIAGDKFVLFKRQDASSSQSTLPIATQSTLGGIMVGDGLAIDVTGKLTVDYVSLNAVKSVNSMVGDVIVNAANLPGLSTVGKTGNYNDLTNKPAPYSLPAGSPSLRGGFRVGLSGNLAVTSDDVLDFSFVPVKTINGTSPDASGNVNTLTAIDGLITPTELLPSTDLNTLVTRSGLYYGTASTTLVNKPLGSSSDGVLEVIRNNADTTVTQRWTTATAVYHRKLNATTWGAWISTPVGAGLIEVRTVNGDYTLVITDVKDLTIRVDSASTATVTLPSDASVALPIGASVLVSRNGVGAVFIAGEVGVTVDTPETYEINKRYGKVVALKTGVDHWEIEGNLVPSL